MSCLNLGKRLLPARKAWRSFTTKLQTKLHKLHASKSIKKKSKTPHQKKIKKTTTTMDMSKYRIRAAVLRPSLSFPPRLLHHHKKQALKRHRGHVVQQKKAAAAALVYVDDLFNDPMSKEVVHRLHPPASTKRMKVVKQPAATAAGAGAGSGSGSGSGEGGGEKCSVGGDQKTCAAADEMWESVGLASPLMYGIDDRAEEFIARFRAGLARGV